MEACHAKSGSPYLVLPSLNISKYLDPLIIYVTVFAKRGLICAIINI